MILKVKYIIDSNFQNTIIQILFQNKYSRAHKYFMWLTLNVHKTTKLRIIFYLMQSFLRNSLVFISPQTSVRDKVSNLYKGRAVVWKTQQLASPFPSSSPLGGCSYINRGYCPLRCLANYHHLFVASLITHQLTLVENKTYSIAFFLVITVGF